ncbi:MAG: CmcJ/NvfI family oxidoreductase [Gammaproteobacteria bacterium]|nr:CmcJ/NvfI family oxidoreductase [Gammaproteobacteria bacterium]
MTISSFTRQIADLPRVDGEIGYLPAEIERAEVRVYPASSGLETVQPETFSVTMPIHDLRPAAVELKLDEQGFEFHRRASSFEDFYNAAAVKERYYPEVALVLKELLSAEAVFVFDHNVRSAVRSARGEPGVREPVAQAHNDYTEASGPVRKDAILQQAQREDLTGHPFALVNLWRPIIGPVQDTPLALCDAASVALEDFVTTDIHHFAEGDVETPAHRGVIYALHHNPRHRWFYASEMQPDEVLLLKCYDSRDDGRARFMPHTGFKNPNCPSDFVPRESIEARTLVVFPEN